MTSRIGIKKTFDLILENTVCQGKHSPNVAPPTGPANGIVSIICPKLYLAPER